MKSGNSNIILSIESSGATCGVALASDKGILGEYSLFSPNLQDRLLAELVRRLLKDLNLSIEDISAVAVSAGPGSFTGLRIGASIAKALCFEETPKLIAVPTLSALAAASDEFAKSIEADGIVAIIPSHKELFYAQKFSNDGELQSEIIFAPTNEIEQMVSFKSVVCGPGAPLFKTGVTLSGLQRLTPRFIARLAGRMFLKGEFTNAEEFVPMYVQEFVPR
ncbi:MAG: tRNA (adenosine(37)-N6)-threonylcarbamoyltransferase complex dimerization subunit type 1 TsaB [Bacteroidota bacterium]